MKIAILSDFHFGFGRGTEREDDPYSAVSEALGKIDGIDLILLGGDLFDGRTPDASVLSRAMELLHKPLLKESSVKFSGFTGERKGEQPSGMSLLGIPVVSIHGTHERRVKGLVNPVQALEKAGFLIHLHCNGAIFEKEGEKVCIQGLSGVPDQYAESVLQEWNPEPLEGCFNIFILHQSVTEFLYAPNTIDLGKIPKGFDYYVNGHIHNPKLTSYEGKPFLLTGSLIPTQLRKEESKEPKSFWVLDTSTGETKRIPLERQRRFYFIDYQGKEELRKKMEDIFSRRHELKPIIRINFPKDSGSEEISETESIYGEKSILSVKRESMEEKKFESKTLEEHKLSVEELGKKLLRQNLEKEGLDPRTFEGIFELLVEGKSDEAIGLLTREKRGENGGNTPESGKNTENPDSKTTQKKLF